MFDRSLQYYLAIALWLIGTAFLQSCQEARTHDVDKRDEGPKKSVIDRDLDSLIIRSKIIVLTKNSSTSYYIYKGQPMGFEYDIIKAFADQHSMRVEVRVVDDMANMYEMLDTGEGDLIAANLTVTTERSERVLFTDPLLQTKQVLVQKKPVGWSKMDQDELDEHMLTDVFELANKKIHVNPNTSFYTRLYNLAEETGTMIQVQAVQPDVDTESLIRMVATDSIKYTVADENVAMLNQTYYPDLDVQLPISLPQKIAWATRINAEQLSGSINNWLSSDAGNAAFRKAYRKYFGSPRSQGKRVKHERGSISGDRISMYDQLIQQEAGRSDWDWRLIAAIMYEESNFDPEAVSWAGAFGLMQLMPKTAAQYGIDSTASDQQNIMAGIALLSDLRELWRDKVPDPIERTKFVVASYNVGAGHILDARQIARDLGLDPNVWTDSVEDCILLKSKPEWCRAPNVRFGYCRGIEPFEYVRDVMSIYTHYKEVYNEPSSE